MLKNTWMALAAVIGLTAFAMAHGTGPHKGPVAEWGEEEYHLEVVVDKTAGTVTVYVYGDDKELHKGTTKPLPKDTKLTLAIKDPATTIKLEASPDKGDPEGKCSKFTATNDIFKKDQKWSGTLSAKVGTKPYSGEFGK